MPVDWKSFCRAPDGDPRYAMDEPYVFAGYRYASDGRISIRGKYDEPDTVVKPAGREIAGPQSLNLYNTHLKRNPVADIPVTQPKFNLLNKTCPMCCGFGFEQIECIPCEGTGAAECDSNTGEVVKKCELCNGSGEVSSKIPCVPCFGKGKQVEYVKFDGWDFQYQYIKKIFWLPCPKREKAIGFKPYRNDKFHTPVPLYFTFTGGEGLLMPVKPE